jgi:alpha,alpha-trehalase
MAFGKTLGKIFIASELNEKENYFTERAAKRRQMINKYFWDENSGFTKIIILKNTTTPSEHIAALYPLFLGIADEDQAKRLRKILKKSFCIREVW